MPTLPKNGSEAKNHFDWELMYYTHLFLTNRGLLITPFHNMMLIPPVATEADIDLLIKGWDDCLAEIAELGRENSSSPAREREADAPVRDETDFGATFAR